MIPFLDMWYYCVIHLLFFRGNLLVRAATPSEVRIGILAPAFKRSGAADFGGRLRRAGTLLALRQVMDRTDGHFDDLFPETEIKFTVRDSMRDYGVSTLEAVYLAKEAFDGTGVAAVIGPASSSPTIAAQNIFKIDQMRVPQISYSATSPLLSDSSVYDLFTRTPVSDAFSAKVIASLVQHFGYSRVNTISGNDDYSTAGISEFALAAEAIGVDVVTSGLFVTGTDDLSEQINRIKASECQLVVMYAQTEDIILALLEGHRQHVVGGGAVWIIGETSMAIINADYIYSSAPNQNKYRLTLETIHTEIITGLFSVFPSMGKGSSAYEAMASLWAIQPSTASTTLDEDGAITYTDCSSDVDSLGGYIWRKGGHETGECFGIDFRHYDSAREGCETELCRRAEMDVYTAFAYDATLTMLRAIHAVIEDHHDDQGAAGDSSFDFSTPAQRELIHEKLLASQFDGTSGNVTFDHNGDRYGDYTTFLVHNFNGAAGEAASTWEVVGQITNGQFASCSSLEEQNGCSLLTRFSDGSSSPPVTFSDPLPTVEHKNYIPEAYVQTVNYITAALLLVCCGCFALTWASRDVPIMRIYQPKVLLVICVGVMISLMSNFATDVSDDEEQESILSADVKCNLVWYFYCTGFMTMFTAMIMKVHRLAGVLKASAKMNHVKVSKTKWIKEILAAVLFNIAIVAIWQYQFPVSYQRKVLRRSELDGLPLESSGSCTGENYGLATILILVFHGFILMIGNYVCFLTRKYDNMVNEARDISIALFNPMQLMLVGAPLLVIAQDDPSFFYLLQSGLVTVNAVIVLLITFAVKFYNLYRYHNVSMNELLDILAEQTTTKKATLATTPTVAGKSNRKRGKTKTADRADSKKSATVTPTPTAGRAPV